jgi:hypothetical protein
MRKLANFGYWLLETHDHRGSDSYSGKAKVKYIEDVLVPLFFNKYPNGILRMKIFMLKRLMR